MSVYTIYHAVDSEALKLYLKWCISEFLCLYVYLEPSRAHNFTPFYRMYTVYMDIDIESARRP